MTHADPKEAARSLTRRERFRRNLKWLREHANEVYRNNRGKCLCIAGEELFVGDTPSEALAAAHAAHPEDDGHFLHYVPLVRRARV